MDRQISKFACDRPAILQGRLNLEINPGYLPYGLNYYVVQLKFYYSK
jgi:hypothetical protein